MQALSFRKRRREKFVAFHVDVIMDSIRMVIMI